MAEFSKYCSSSLYALSYALVGDGVGVAPVKSIAACKGSFLTNIDMLCAISLSVRSSVQCPSICTAVSNKEV